MLFIYCLFVVLFLFIVFLWGGPSAVRLSMLYSNHLLDVAGSGAPEGAPDPSVGVLISF